VKKFLRGWNLDVDNAVDMMRCTREVQKVVMDEFSQEDGSKNVNVDFHVFIWRFLQADGSVKPKRTAAQPVPEPAASPEQEQEPVPSPVASPVPEPEAAPEAPPLDVFVEKWDLDEDAIDQLLEMSHEEQEEVEVDAQQQARLRRDDEDRLQEEQVRGLPHGELGEGEEGPNSAAGNITAGRRAEAHTKVFLVQQSGGREKGGRAKEEGMGMGSIAVRYLLRPPSELEQEVAESEDTGQE